MTIKPFAIQGADLTLGGVNLQAGATGVVIPGVTYATSYNIEEVNDTGEQTFSFSSIPEVIDNTRYTTLAGSTSPQSSYVDAQYAVTELDGEGFIDGIDVADNGTWPASILADLAENNDMWAYVGSAQDPFATFVRGDWMQIPFRPKMRAGEIQTIGGGDGGIALRTVNFPYGASGDIKGTLALTPGDEVYVCIADYVEPSSEPTEFTVLTSEGYNLTQSGDPGTLMQVIIARGDYPAIDTIMDTLGYQATGWQVSGNTTDGYVRDCVAEVASGNRWAFTWTYVGGQDNSSYAQGEEFALFYTAVQSTDVIWQKLSTGTANLVQFQNAGSVYQETDDTPGRYNIVINAEKDVVFNTDEGGNTFSLTSGGTLKFPDGSEQSTAATGGGVTINTDLWVAAGSSPGGAAVVTSTNGTNWTTVDYTAALGNQYINKVAIGSDRIVYIIGGLNNGANTALYYTDAPENTPVLATGTDFYGMGFPLEWRELNYLGGKFVAVGSYTVNETINTSIDSIALADGSRTAPRVTLTNTSWNFNQQLITISGATNTELNGEWRLIYNSLDTRGSGVYELWLTDQSLPVTVTSTDVTGVSVAGFTDDCFYPMYAYSTDGMSWTYGTVDGGYLMMVLGTNPRAKMADVAYNGTGYLIPVIDTHFYVDDPYAGGVGAFYITDLAGGANGPQFIPGGGPGSLPGLFNNIAAYGDGTFFVSDDAYTVWTNADPANDPWVDHNIQSALTAHFGYDVGIEQGQVDSQIFDSVAGTIGGQEMFVTTIGEGVVAWTTDNGTTWQCHTIDPYTYTLPLNTQGGNTLIDLSTTGVYPWERISLTVAPGDDTRWNGIYYVYNDPITGLSQLYDGVEGNAIDSAPWTYPTQPFNIALFRGRGVGALHIGGNTCIVEGSDQNKLYRSTDMINWTTVFTNEAYSIDDIYYATRTATAYNRFDYTDEDTGYTSTAVLTYDFEVDVDNAHLNIRGDGSWDIGSSNFRTKIYSAGPEEPNLVIVQATDKYWTFSPDGKLSFPDGSRQQTAYVHRNINLDGGGAMSHYDTDVAFADGGFSSTRHGVADASFDGGNRLTEENQLTLDGGGA